MSEAEIADVESFLLDILSVFPLIGLGVFEKTEVKKSPRDLLLIDSKGIRASGYEDAKGFVVCKGSQLVKEEVPSIPRNVSTLRGDLIEQGVIAPDGQHYAFTQDHVLNSPSIAAAVVLGRSANGRTEWKSKEGTTLKELQEAATEVAG